MLKPAYHLRQALLCLRHSPYAALVAAASVAVALSLCGGAWLTERSIEAVLRSSGADASITLFLTPRVREGAKLAGLAASAAGPGSTARFVTPDEALARLRADLGDAGRALGDLAENPLPPTIEVRLSSSRLAEGDLREIHEAAVRLKVLPGVTEVDDGASFVSHLQGVLRAVRASGLVLLIVVLGVALFLVGNVVRLSVYARRDEIDILRLVGATDAFIASPFAIEGTVQGLAGGIVAVVIVHLAEAVALPRAAAAFGFGQELLPAPIGWLAPLVLILLGAAVGLLASLVAVLRFLRRAP